MARWRWRDSSMLWHASVYVARKSYIADQSETIKTSVIVCSYFACICTSAACIYLYGVSNLIKRLQSKRFQFWIRRNLSRAFISDCRAADWFSFCIGHNINMNIQNTVCEGISSWNKMNQILVWDPRTFHNQ